MRFTFACLLLVATACSSSTTRPGEGDAGPPDAFTVFESGPAPDADPPRPDAFIPPTDGGGPDVAPPPMDASILPPYDAGDPFGDAGVLGPPEWVDLEIRTDGTMCPALIACGGDVVGTWDTQGGCFEVNPPMELMRCPGAELTGATGRARGRVIFDGMFAHRVAQSEVTADLFIPGFCAEFVGGCEAIEMRIQMNFPDSACITDAAADCQCEIRQINTIDQRDAYTLSMNQIVSSTGRRWDYCISGDTLTYRDVSGGMGPREPGTIDLARR